MNNPKYFKGAITEVFFIIVILLLIGASMLWISMYVSNSITYALNTTGQVPSHTMNQVVQLQNDYNYFDYYIVFFVNGAALASIVLGAFLNSDPRYFSPALLILIILLFLSFYLSNVFMAIGMNSNLVHFSAQTPLIDYMIAYLPYIVLIYMGAYILVVSLRKRGE